MFTFGGDLSESIFLSEGRNQRFHVEGEGAMSRVEDTVFYINQYIKKTKTQLN